MTEVGGMEGEAELTEDQKAWLSKHPDYTPVGPPRPGVRFTECGTLYADGSFVKGEPMKPVQLRPGCICVGIKVGDQDQS